jgi:hypothetical protein
MMTALPLSIALAILATLAHEIGHLLGAVVTGAEIKAIGIRWAGFYVHACVNPPCRWKARVNLLSGAVANALLALACWGLDWKTFALVNALTALFNLLLPKSDGWQAARIAVGRTA